MPMLSAHAVSTPGALSPVPAVLPDLPCQSWCSRRLADGLQPAGVSTASTFRC